MPQIIYHSGLFFIGTGLGYLGYSQNLSFSIFSLSAALTLLLCVWLSWIASVVFNDINDFKIDVISNPERPLPQKIFAIEEYAQLGIFCFLLALLGALSVGYVFAVLLFVYQFLAWLYSGSLWRLKKIPFLATFTSALASLTILFTGYILLSDNQTIRTLSPRIIFLLLATYTLALPIKDFKDIAGDAADGVRTLPVIFGEKKARLVVAVNIFVSYILSVFFLNELDLFWWALLFGIATFLIVTNETISPRKLPAWVLGMVSVYTVILTWIVFF
jgi:4-hydroxybenzoate polyprenyltransferase